MKFQQTLLRPFIALGIAGIAGLPLSVLAQTTPGSANQNTPLSPNAVGPQGISPPVSGNFGVTQSPGTMATPGYSPGAGPSSGVGGGAGPGSSFGAPFSGTGHGINSLGRTSPDTTGTIPSGPATGIQGGATGLGGSSGLNPSIGSGAAAGSPGPSMGTTPASGALAPGAGGGATGAAGGR